MDVDRTDLAIFVYNSGVVLSGGFIAITFEMGNYTELVPLSLVFGVLWTLYYRAVMEENLRPFDEEEDVPERELPSQADEPDDEEPPEQGGPDAPWE
ncbi:hypothetical protein HLRTI_002728 [Halorhabdus tiamatea SARL4B]|uniref:DUF8074 domain-containing protein n=1 Tax=Halorhabdus tiamatea SARL4B TaxID=1033806 RepID=F7PNL9_9EURY|nr:hypothetical protein [Halorhabdus tiamatea]ERJ05286.1 hypothetical protein HLRTI_002728 [Halorhabdus tiamatea SARL4B]CCQ33745.1 conserved hypothetical protein [Halorhabdus tiamatea SARL4B]